jgi:hypothetical protein
MGIAKDLPRNKLNAGIDDHLLFPIPQSEIQVNQNLLPQNPGC